LVTIIEVIGSPSEEDLLSISNQSARNYIKSIPYTPPANYQQMYPNASPAGITSHLDS
jgi:mitogen-activated protein kinase 1/3